MRIHTRPLASLLAALLLTACGQPDATSTTAAAGEQAAAVAVAAGVPAEALAAAPPASLGGEPVDTCALLDSEAALAVVGSLYKPAEARPAQGSLLGQCEYFGKRRVLMLSARPAAEYTATVSYAAKNGSARTLEGLAGTAAMTPMGLMLQPIGKPYFLVVYTMAGGKFDEDAALAIGRQLKL